MGAHIVKEGYKAARALLYFDKNAYTFIAIKLISFFRVSEGNCLLLCNPHPFSLEVLSFLIKCNPTGAMIVLFVFYQFNKRIISVPTFKKLKNNYEVFTRS